MYICAGIVIVLAGAGIQRAEKELLQHSSEGSSQGSSVCLHREETKEEGHEKGEVEGGGLMVIVVANGVVMELVTPYGSNGRM